MKLFQWRSATKTWLKCRETASATKCGSPKYPGEVYFRFKFLTSKQKQESWQGLYNERAANSSCLFDLALKMDLNSQQSFFQLSKYLVRNLSPPYPEQQKLLMVVDLNTPHRGQRTICSSYFSTSALWILGIRCRLSFQKSLFTDLSYWPRKRFSVPVESVLYLRSIKWSSIIWRPFLEIFFQLREFLSY